MDRFVTRVSRSSSSLPSSHGPAPTSQAGPLEPLAVTSTRSAKRSRLQTSTRPLAKRRRLSTEIPDSEDDSHDSSAAVDNDDKSRLLQSDFDTTLPPIEVNKAAIEEYEHFKASQQSQTGQHSEVETAGARLDSRQWVQGRSSIYVDAFNMALDTVLEDESHLFDEQEQAVFAQWHALSYETQYLYVRLFLRKTACWHRIEKLRCYGDISDLSSAISSLLESRLLPCGDGSGEKAPAESVAHMQMWSLPNPVAFADASESHINTVEEAASLLSLEELRALAKDAKVQGSNTKNKRDLVRAFCQNSAKQAGLLSMGLLRRSTTIDSGSASDTSRDPSRNPSHAPSRAASAERGKQQEDHSNRNGHFLSKILTITGPLVRLSEPVFRLFERVHLVFYRSAAWTEKSLTTIILARIQRLNFASYLVCRTNDFFASRAALVEFEQSIRLEHEVDSVLESGGPPGAEGFRKVVAVFEEIQARWRDVLRREQRKEDLGYVPLEGADEFLDFLDEGAPYLRRFMAAHAYTRIAHKAAYVLGRLHQYKEEHALLSELLAQHFFHPARRGAWYQRKALLEERYMWEFADVNPDPSDPSYADGAAESAELRKKRWLRAAAATCQAGLEDRDCHLIYHYDLQKRLVKLERRLRIPRRLQHDFGHVRLRKPEEHTVEGVQLVREDNGRKTLGVTGRGTSTKTVWLDDPPPPPPPPSHPPDEEGEEPIPLSSSALHVSVEEMCLSYYRRQGWKGYHSEGGILRTLFALLFFDLLFAHVPRVFQTAFQAAPLDLHTDAFYACRAGAIEHRLAAISNGEGARILAEADERERPRRTVVVGLNWDFDSEDLKDLAGCFEGHALAAVCKVMAQEYRARGGGVPDLVLWRVVGSRETQQQDHHMKVTGEVLFAEVKSANDRLSDTQRLWIHVLTGAGVRVALCNAVAKEVRLLD